MKTLNNYINEVLVKQNIKKNSPLEGFEINTKGFNYKGCLVKSQSDKDTKTWEDMGKRTNVFIKAVTDVLDNINYKDIILTEFSFYCDNLPTFTIKSKFDKNYEAFGWLILDNQDKPYFSPWQNMDVEEYDLKDIKTWLARS